MKKWLIALIPVLILGSLVAWQLTKNHREKMKQVEQRASRSGAAVSVELASPQYRDIVASYEATGSVESIQNVKISPKVSGNITYLTVREGDRVRQGQVLVRIDQSAVLAAVREQQASLAEAKFRLAQAQLTQTPTDIAISTQIRQQEASVSSAEADLAQATQNRASQLQAVKATLDDAQSKIDSANAVIANANASINSAQANLDNATAKYNRVLGLYKQGFVAAQDVDDAKTTVSVQQAALDTARGQLQAATAAAKSMSAQKRNVEQQGNITISKADADLAATRAKLVQAKASLEYAQANAKQSPAYRQSLEALKAGVAAAQASLESAQAKVDDTVLRSPLDGVVTGRTQDLGSLASPGQAVLTVQAMKKVWVSIAVPAEVSVKLRLNQPATVTFDALNGRSFTARIAQINPSADLQSRQYTVRVILDNADNLFTAGMFARVTLITDSVKHVLAVPREAVELVEKDGSHYVIAATKDSTAERRTVVTGVEDAAWIAILSGVRMGDQVVIMSASTLKDGQKLRTNNDKQGKGGGKDGARRRQRGAGDGSGAPQGAPAGK